MRLSTRERVVAAYRLAIGAPGNRLRARAVR